MSLTLKKPQKIFTNLIAAQVTHRPQVYLLCCPLIFSSVTNKTPAVRAGPKKFPRNTLQPANVILISMRLSLSPRTAIPPAFPIAATILFALAALPAAAAQHAQMAPHPVHHGLVHFFFHLGLVGLF